jgi:cyclic beta-1,2-glucan synthetase
MASAAGSLFARTYAGHTGVDPYTTAVSDVYQDLFGEGIFTGKGCTTSTRSRPRSRPRAENALLSHDLFEGLYARTALVTDVEVVDDYPSSVLAHARASTAGCAATGRFLWWLFPFVPSRRACAQSPAAHRALEDPRQPAPQPGAAGDAALLVLGWTALPAPPAAWTAIGLARLRSRRLSRALHARGPRAPAVGRSCARAEDLKTRRGARRLQLAFMANDACERLHAIAITLVRLGVTRRACWSGRPAAAKRACARPGTVRAFCRGMRPSPLPGPRDLVDRGSCARALPWRADHRVSGCRPVDRLRLSRPAAAPRAAASADRRLPAQDARKTWAYFDAFVGAETMFLPPDNVQVGPELTIAHRRRRPTSASASRDLAAHDLGFIERRTPAPDRPTLTTSSASSDRRPSAQLVRHADAGAAAPAYVSTVDSGNLAGALLTLSVGLRDLAPPLAARANVLFDAMNFRFLFDPRRQLFSIGYRLADTEGPGRQDPSYYDLLASEARLASFLAIAKGDVPEMHWFHLGRPVTSVRGAPVLLSWSATLFEYLMPLLVMRSSPNTLLDDSCRLVVRRQMDYGNAHGVPWGISESAYNVTDRHGTYQYKAFGVPGWD